MPEPRMGRPPPAPADREAGAATHALFALCVAACAAFLIWAHLGTLPVVSVAAGEVMPSSQVKEIQHLEGGIVAEIAVREGEAVTAGQPLVILESTFSGTSVEELRVRRAGLLARIARLRAEAEGAEQPAFPDEVATSDPDLVARERTLFDTRRRHYQSELSVKQQQAAQRAEEVEETRARLRHQRKALKLLEEQVAISEDLLKDDLTNRYNHLELLRQATSLRSSVEEDRAVLRRHEAALAEAREQVEAHEQAYLAEVREELTEARRQLDELNQRLLRASDSLDRTVVRAPADGVIKTLHVHTVGGVAKPGETLVELVPADDRLIVEARLPPHDIGYVRIGQKARVKLASADATRFGDIDGKVIHVSPDTITDEDGKHYYKVRLETAQSSFRRGSLEYRLFPGVQVTAYIHTGQRSVLDYLLEPFLLSMDTALQER